MAVDGLHEAKLEGELVNLKMMDVNAIESIGNDHYLDTGSPHYIKETENLKDLALVTEAHKVRYNSRFEKEGTNVNFVKYKPDFIHVRTYERGVEDETLACGTGVTAVALVAELLGKNTDFNRSKIKAKGGDLEVSYAKQKNGFSNIWLKGPAKQVFKGSIDL